MSLEAHAPEEAESRRAALPLTRLLAAFYCSGFVLVGGGFVLYTSSVDPEVARETGAGSPLSQAILGLYYLSAALLLAANPDRKRILLSAWPVLVLPALAFISSQWSPDPSLTIRRAVAFSGTIIFGLSFGSAYRYRDAIRLIVTSLALVMAISIVLAFADPAMAIHQVNDAIQAVHAGSWRGIFAHRNTLGFWSGASIVLIALAGGEAFGSRSLQAAAILGAVVCLFASGSSAGIAMVALSALYFLALTSTLRQTGQKRVAVAGLWILAASLVFLFFEAIARIGLQLLGRDSDLSGRTELWSYIIGLLDASEKPLGLGYFVGTLVLDQRLQSATQIHNVNAHNGFLEAYVYFGGLGVALAAALAAWFVVISIRFAAGHLQYIGSLSTLPAVMVFLALAHNLVESTLVSPNNLNNVLLATVAAMAARARLP
jgi:exopolysaccharide production protein ExoQ